MKLERKCKCGCITIYKKVASYERAERENRSCRICSLKRKNWVTMEQAIEFYRGECIKKSLPINKIDKSTWPDNIPKDPFSVYRKDGFQMSMINEKNWVSIQDAIEFYKNEIKLQNIINISKLDKSNWPDNIPKNPQSVYSKSEFIWGLVTGNIRPEYVDIEDAIVFYRSEIERQNVNQHGLLDKSTWPDNIPKWPVEHYGILWSDITGNKKDSSREEIARLVMSYIDIIDNLDDMMIAILLSKISDKEKISKLVSKKVTKLIKKIVEENKQGDRKEALVKLSQDIIDNKVDDLDIDGDLDIDEDGDLDIDEDGDLDIDVDNTSDEKKDDISYEDKLKKRINIMEKAILNDDVDIDYKKLLQDNALKLMWYLEVSK